MIYQFTLLSDESDDFVRKIQIDADATFFDLHEAILSSVNYQKDQITSFFLCNDDWRKEEEITLIEMDTSSEFDNLVMEQTILRDYVSDEEQKILYVFDTLEDRAFFITLEEIVLGQSLEQANCIESIGKPPLQQLSENYFDLGADILDVDFYGDETFNEDDLDEDGFSDMDMTNQDFE